MLVVMYRLLLLLFFFADSRLAEDRFRLMAPPLLLPSLAWT